APIAASVTAAVAYSHPVLRTTHIILPVATGVPKNIAPKRCGPSPIQPACSDQDGLPNRHVTARMDLRTRVLPRTTGHRCSWTVAPGFCATKAMTGHERRWPVLRQQQHTSAWRLRKPSRQARPRGIVVRHSRKLSLPVRITPKRAAVSVLPLVAVGLMATR